MRKHDPDELFRVIKKFLKLPRPAQIAVVVLIIVFIVVCLLIVISKKEAEPPPARPERQPTPEEGYLFCFWNVENLFDDRDDDRGRDDEVYDTKFALDAEMRSTKLRNLSKVLLSMNGGNGPDILALAEIETERAVELLQDRLNEGLPAGAAPFKVRLFVEQKQGRHIAPAILTRLPVLGERKEQLGKRSHRILKGQIAVNGQELAVIASHWKSRVQTAGSKRSDEEGRAEYADVIHGEYKAMYRSNPAVDLLVCGDFNDDPDDDSVVKHLKATGDRTSLMSGDDPLLFSLAAGKPPAEFGTLWYSRWHVFDQIAVSAGMLDGKGWTCLPETFKTMREKMSNARGRPWRFDEDSAGHRTKDNAERGFADHFPVTVRLKVLD